MIKNLLQWMEAHLNQQSSFSVNDLEKFFAGSFVIKTNSRTVHATPSAYREYLYGLKSTLTSVKYDIEEMIEVPGAVVVPFVIHLNFAHKKPQNLRTISIFKLNSDYLIWMIFPSMRFLRSGV